MNMLHTYVQVHKQSMTTSLLSPFQVETKDALLHAINEEYVEAVEMLLEHEETIHVPGEPHVRGIQDYQESEN